MIQPKLDPSAPTSAQTTSRAILFGGGLLAILLLIILFLQLRGIWLHYQFYITTGIETPVAYGIWKVQEGYPLYSWPTKDFYQLTLYNFASYYLYAKVLNLLHVHGPEIMLYGRYLTTLFACCGILIQARMLCFLARDLMSRTVKAAIMLVSFYTWFNSFFPGYFPVSVRADIPAVAVSTLGLYFFIRYVTGGEWRWVCGAALAWAAAWCFKQADVACIFGAGVYLLACRKWRDVAILVAAFWIPVGIVLLLGSPEYRWNILVAATISGMYLKIGLRLFFGGVVLSLFSWTFVVTLPLYLSRTMQGVSERKVFAVWKAMCPGNPLAPFIALAFVVVFGGLLSFAELCKNGSSLNYMLEVFVAATSLSFILALRLATLLSSRSVRRLNLAVCFTLLSMCAFPACQLAMHRIGPIVRATDAEVARKQNFALFLKSLKKPLFIDDEIYSMPWYSTDNQYPAITLDHVFYDEAMAKGVISGGVPSLIKKHWFGTLYLAPGSGLYQEAMAAHYQNLSIPAADTSYLDALGHERTNFVALAAP